jgi:periplasmic divalent cation tolerance protein
MKREYRVVWVTAPDIQTARRLARAALEARLVACANIVPRIESHYWWQGKLEAGKEVLLVFKTTRRALKALEACILSQHPYETAEFIALPVVAGAKRYLDWVTASTAPVTEAGAEAVNADA